MVTISITHSCIHVPPTAPKVSDMLRLFEETRFQLRDHGSTLEAQARQAFTPEACQSAAVQYNSLVEGVKVRMIEFQALLFTVPMSSSWMSSTACRV